MLGKAVVFLSCLLTFGFCQDDYVTYLVDGIDDLEEDVLNYTFPENAYPYFEPVEDTKDLKNAGSYDFIIIGAGSSGTVLARRLTEDHRFRVLLLEAGTWENNFTDIPGIAEVFRASPYSWGYNIVPQKDFGGYINNSFGIPRGKAVGGTSVINSMIYARGNKADFNKWASLGNPSWSYDNVLSYFKKSENASFPGDNDGYHGFDGSLHVEYSRIVDDLGQAFIDAGGSLGYKEGDYNGADQMVFSVLQMNEINGVRDSGAKAFIDPVIKRSNLIVSPESFVLKVHIDDERVARGVKFIRNGTLYYAKACREVIVSAGALQTPQILMLSGIGHCEHLTENDITCLNDLPVGDNLWDHLIYNSLAYSVNKSYPSLSLETQVKEYLNGSGPLTSPGTVQDIAYVSVTGATNQVPDIEHVIRTSRPGENSYEYYKAINRYTPETYKYVVQPQGGISQWSIHSVLLHPKSSGTVRLKSSDPFDFPQVDPKYFSELEDVTMLREGLRNAQQLAATPPLQKYNSTIINVTHPLCADYTWDSNDYWDCMVRNLAYTTHHFAGTCKMGPTYDPSTVVNENLQVHGIRNLRVVDCSVIPITLSGHTNAPAYMIGEKAADIIKEAHRFFYGDMPHLRSCY